jgi:hypothetical protein
MHLVALPQGRRTAHRLTPPARRAAGALACYLLDGISVHAGGSSRPTPKQRPSECDDARDVKVGARTLLLCRRLDVRGRVGRGERRQRHVDEEARVLAHDGGRRDRVDRDDLAHPISDVGHRFVGIDGQPKAPPGLRVASSVRLRGGFVWSRWTVIIHLPGSSRSALAARHAHRSSASGRGASRDHSTDRAIRHPWLPMVATMTIEKAACGS